MMLLFVPRALSATVGLLAVIALIAGCGADAPPTAANPEATAPAEKAASSPTASARPALEQTPAPSAAPLTATPLAQPTAPPPSPTPIDQTPTPAPDAEPRADPTPTATPIPTASPSEAPTAPPTATSPEPSSPTPTATPQAQDPAWLGTLGYRVHAVYPHDTSSFTQGLLWFDGLVYESTGLRGQSVLRAVDLPTGRILREATAAPQHFGEGLALVDDQLIWLTWQAGTAGVYQRNTLEQTGSFTYTGEGWGLCHDGTRLVMSDGSSTLTFRHPTTFEVLGSVAVSQADGSPVARLNELECVGNYVWANVWLTDRIVVIDPATGAVTAEADMAGIITPHPQLTDSNNVLNGIAYRPDTGTFLITGKRWPVLFEVRFE
ncbi:MAG: glutaminyl-peptide cyclotransferase [bacterium]|nr:glutaminyl-peptide cyclotransferase [bacterium]